MKMNYKVASLALVGALVAQTFITIPVFAEENSKEVLVNEEAVVDTVSSENETIEELVTSGETENASEENADVNDVKADEETENTAEINEANETIETNEANETNETQEVVTETEESVEVSSEDLENDETLELVEADENEDFNNDGINDLYTKMLCDGEILTESGAKVFGDYTYAKVQSTDDLDGDGLLNGAEVEIKTNEDGTRYAVLVSDPCNVDSDNDGINDYDDTAKWERGLAGGVLGCVRLIAHHDEEVGFMDGHVFIVYTSYVNNLEISIDNLYGYYLANPEKKALLDAACDAGEGSKVISWRSTAEELSDANYEARRQAADELYIRQQHEPYARGTVVLNRGDYCSIANYSLISPNEIIETDYIPFIQKELTKLTLKEKLAIIDYACKVLNQEIDADYYKDHIGDVIQAIAERTETFMDHAINGHTPGGVFINQDLNHQKLAWDQGPNEVVEQDATAEQLNVMLNHFAKNSYYNIFTHNCVTVSAGAWNEVYGYKTDENGNRVKTDYYVNEGNRYTGITYSPKSKSIKPFDITINHPGAVKDSIKTMKDLPGYIGNMTYVTGKKLVNTLNAAIKHFDITKLFKKKAIKDTENKKTTEDKSSPSSSSHSSSVYAVSNNTTIETKDEVIVADSNILSDDKEAEQKAKERFAQYATNNKSKDEDTKKTTTVNSNDDTEEISVTSNEKTVTINNEEVPLAVSEKQDNFLWAWVVLTILLLAIVIATTVAVIRKRND